MQYEQTFRGHGSSRRASQENLSFSLATALSTSSPPGNDWMSLLQSTLTKISALVQDPFARSSLARESYDNASYHPKFHSQRRVNSAASEE
jgi:hypothetical protein